MNFVHNFSDFIKDFVCFCQFKDFSSYIIYGFQYITFCLQCKDFLSYMQHYQCIFKVEGQFKKKKAGGSLGLPPARVTGAANGKKQMVRQAKQSVIQPAAVFKGKAVYVICVNGYSFDLHFLHTYMYLMVYNFVQMRYLFGPK